MVQIPTIYDFMKAKICHTFPSEKYMVKTGQKYTLDFNTSCERPFSKLSENNVIGPTEQVMVVQRRALLNAIHIMCCRNLAFSVND